MVDARPRTRAAVASVALAIASWLFLLLIPVAAAMVLPRPPRARLVTSPIAPLVFVIEFGWPLLAALAVVTGHIARSRVKRSGARGADAALVGLVLGYASGALFVLLTLFTLGIAILIGSHVIHVPATPSTTP